MNFVISQQAVLQIQPESEKKLLIFRVHLLLGTEYAWSSVFVEFCLI